VQIAIFPYIGPVMVKVVLGLFFCKKAKKQKGRNLGFMFFFRIEGKFKIFSYVFPYISVVL